MQELQHRTLTDADLDAIMSRLQCQKICGITHEEVQFVRDWMETAKTAKSELVRWLVKGILVVIGVVTFLLVASKMGWQDSVR